MVEKFGVLEVVLTESRTPQPAVGRQRHPLAAVALAALILLPFLQKAYTIDDLAARSGRLAADLLAELARLELEGRVTRTGGGHFAKA